MKPLYGYIYPSPKFTAMGGISEGLQTLGWDLERDFGTSWGSQKRMGLRWDLESPLKFQICPRDKDGTKVALFWDFNFSTCPMNKVTSRPYRLAGCNSGLPFSWLQLCSLEIGVVTR
jgi:hypothetical protein